MRSRSKLDRDIPLLKEKKSTVLQICQHCRDETLLTLGIFILFTIAASFPHSLMNIHTGSMYTVARQPPSIILT